MYTCRACLKRASHAQSGQVLLRNPNVNRYKLLLFRTTTRVSRPNRQYATVATHRSPAGATSPIEERYSAESHRRRVPVASRSTEWAARKELSYMNDPFHIARRVKSALLEDNWDLAQNITNKASKGKNVTVSWNHLIEYQLQHGRLHGALKLYNEMKKRSQEPNAQTFTIIFRGCARSQHPKLAVNEAVKLYQNMMTAGRIKPNTIHLNATLQVCAKAGDIESMFSILTSSTGPLRSPNNLTYTTIFNALRKNAEQAEGNSFERLQDKEVKREKETAITRAKSIWNEVVQKWRSGSLVIDEELVCAMGRILLMGGYKDADAIESLIEQTMMIPRTNNKGLSGQESATPPVTGPVTQAPGVPAINYALPGNNSLSLVLEAVERTRRTTQAVKYWNLFTLHHKVVPDADNWARAFRVFQCGKNSGRATTALQNMPAEMRTPKHVRLALKACLRDYHNKMAFDHATKIMEIMDETPDMLDVQALRIYLQVAHATKHSYDADIKEDSSVELRAWARNLASALDRLFNPFVTLTRCLHDPTRPSEPRSSEQTRNWRAEVVALGRKMCAAHDILTTGYKAILSEAQLAKITPQHVFLSKYVTSYFEEAKQESKRKAEPEEDPSRRKPTRWQGNAEDNVDWRQGPSRQMRW